MLHHKQTICLTQESSLAFLHRSFGNQMDLILRTLDHLLKSLRYNSMSTSLNQVKKHLQPKLNNKNQISIFFPTRSQCESFTLSRASSSVMLLDMGGRGEDNQATQQPSSSLMMHPIPATPGFPLVAPSKFNSLNQFARSSKLFSDNCELYQFLLFKSKHVPNKI